MSRHATPLFLILSIATALVFAGCDSIGPSQEDDDSSQENSAPTASATANQTSVDVGTEVTLDASGSEDPDGDDLSFSWTLTAPSGSEASLSDATVEQPTFTPDVDGDYTASVSVSDGDTSDTDEVTVTATGGAGAVEISSDITSDDIWTSDNTYRVTNTVSVDNNSTLTIESGVQIRFENDVALRVNSGSAIVAEGTSSAPISMTATDGNEQQGWWRGIAFYSNNANNSFNHVEVRHAGSNDMSGISQAANVALDDGAILNLRNSTISEGGKYGLYLNNGEATLESFSANNFSGNDSAPMWIPFTNIGKVDSGSSFDDGTTVRVYGNTLPNESITVSALSGDTPYRFSSTPATGNASVTIDPGVEMTFESDVAFWVSSGSELVADGAANNASDPITMTATAGNDQQGWWRGIAFYSSNANNTLNLVEVRHGGITDMSGISDPANVALDDGAILNLSNSTITDSGGAGVYCNNSESSLTETGNSFNNNNGQNVANCQ